MANLRHLERYFARQHAARRGHGHIPRRRSGWQLGTDLGKKATESSGYQGYFRTRLAQLVAKSKTGYVSPYDLADTYVRLGDREQALHWLNLAYQERSPYLANLQIEPRLDSLRSDPRFQELVERVGLSKVQPMSISAQAAQGILPHD